LSQLEPTEIDLLISFHEQRAEHHANRVEELKAIRDEGLPEMNNPPIRPKGIVPKKSLPAAIRELILAAVDNPAEGNEGKGRTMRGIGEYLSARGVDLDEGKITSIVQAMILEKALVKDMDMYREPQMKGGRATNNHPWKRRGHYEAEKKNAKERTKKRAARDAGLKTKKGEPITRTRAIQNILAKAYMKKKMRKAKTASMTTREIYKELCDNYGDKGEIKTIAAAMCGMAKRGTMMKNEDGTWRLPKGAK
jgi:hypothetical protein